MSSMIATNRRKLAYELGSKADTRQFIPFSKNTNTNNGRKVFIDAALAPLFAHFFQADDANTIRIVSKIEQLSAIAGGISANTNVTTPFEYMENIGELAIYYQLHNSPQGNQVESGVYITGVKRASKRSSTKAELIEITPWATKSVDSELGERYWNFEPNKPFTFTEEPLTDMPEKYKTYKKSLLPFYNSIQP